MLHEVESDTLLYNMKPESRPYPYYNISHWQLTHSRCSIGVPFVFHNSTVGVSERHLSECLLELLLGGSKLGPERLDRVHEALLLAPLGVGHRAGRLLETRACLPRLFAHAPDGLVACRQLLAQLRDARVTALEVLAQRGERRLACGRGGVPGTQLISLN